MLVDVDAYRENAFARIFQCMNATKLQTAVTTWTIDPMHTAVAFSVRHLMITNVRGEFRQVRGTVEFDRAHPDATKVDIEIPSASIDTREELRDRHLRSAEFFDVEAHPLITFRSTNVKVEAGAISAITGALTIRGETREVTLAVAEVTGEQKDHNGNVRVGASATTIIKRSEFGMTYNRVLEAGNLAVGDAVTLTLDVSLVKDAPR